MRAYEVKAGTAVQVIKKGKEFSSVNMVEHTCKEDNLFFQEDIVVDPFSYLNRGKTSSQYFPASIGGAYEAAGYYGFKSECGNWTMLVGMGSVEVY